MSKLKVAFICVHNSCRSQIAEALHRQDTTGYETARRRARGSYSGVIRWHGSARAFVLPSRRLQAAGFRSGGPADIRRPAIMVLP